MTKLSEVIKIATAKNKIEFEFMEPFPHDTSINKIDIVKSIKITKDMGKEYPIYKLFGHNEEWRDAINEIFNDIIEKKSKEDADKPAVAIN